MNGGLQHYITLQTKAKGTYGSRIQGHVCGRVGVIMSVWGRDG
jgi:hypothetical protein